jgi:hypothetical protein
MPTSHCVHIQRVPSHVVGELSQEARMETHSAAPSIFRYWYWHKPGKYVYAMRFWDTLMFWLAFQAEVSEVEPT